MTAAEHIILMDTATIDGEQYIRFTGRIPSTLNPVIEVVLKVTRTQIIVVYHANTATQGFFDQPITHWI